VIGTDPKTDLALIKIKSETLPVREVCRIAGRVGDIVMAVGVAGLGGSVTTGIVSARGRDWLRPLC
jgi:S1-C subfamily serine protease